LIYGSNYIDLLVEYCKHNNINAILSFFDVDLPILGKAKDRFKKEDISVVISDYDVIKICNDKWETYNFLRKNLLDTPKTFLGLDDAKVSLDKKDIGFPLMIKPRWGMGTIGLYEVDNWKELEVFYVKSKKDVFKSYLSYASGEDPEHCILI
jgi:carbamoyl-phosphate synthase large subunit